MVKNGYYGNEDFGFAWDRVKLSQIAAFITTRVIPRMFVTSVR